MFGFIYWIVGLSSALSNNIRNDLYKDEQRKKVNGKEFRLYYDIKGRSFWDGEQVFRMKKEIAPGKWHEVLEKHNGVIVWDFTQHEIDKEINNIKNINKTARDNAIKNNKGFYMQQIGKHNYKTELSTGNLVEVYSFDSGKIRYYKKYYKLNGMIKEYDEEIEISKDEYIYLGCGHCNYY